VRTQDRIEAAGLKTHALTLTQAKEMFEKQNKMGTSKKLSSRKVRSGSSMRHDLLSDIF
jgi:hypothetical protein